VSKYQLKLSNWCDSIEDAKQFIEMNKIKNYDVVVLWKEGFDDESAVLNPKRKLIK
jgi:hypothetical protein